MRTKYILAFLAITLIACSTVPLTGRKQMNLLSDGQMMGMASTSYGEFLKENPALPASDSRSQMVKRVGEKVSAAAKEYLRDNGMVGRVNGFRWEFKVVDSPEKNAWCMPGGKVVFYTGIMEITKDEKGLAVVMGHEIAHAIARHGNERMSQAMALEMGGMGLNLALSKQTELTRNIFLQSYGMGSNLGSLKFSRVHESESDHMGLVFMAKAGYDPSEAPKFWQRMKAAGGQAPPEFLSTHPSASTRISDLNKWMAEAKGYFKGN
ncbi:MAG: putative Zn-dependent protease [Psychroserpens sp.]|jgi:predicted Zn-dependent protease